MACSACMSSWQKMTYVIRFKHPPQTYAQLRLYCASGVDLDEVFTTDLASTPVHVAKWGFLGESWPFFRPNFVNMEQYKTDMSVDEVIFQRAQSRLIRVPEQSAAQVVGTDCLTCRWHRLPDRSLAHSFRGSACRVPAQGAGAQKSLCSDAMMALPTCWFWL